MDDTSQVVDGNLFETKDLNLKIGDAYPKEGIIKTRLTSEADQSYIPYARHYNPRFVFFLPPFLFEVRFILQTTYVWLVFKGSF